MINNTRWNPSRARTLQQTPLRRAVRSGQGEVAPPPPCDARTHAGTGREHRLIYRKTERRLLPQGQRGGQTETLPPPPPQTSPHEETIGCPVA